MAKENDPDVGSSYKGIFQTPFNITGSTNPDPVNGWGSQTPTAKIFDYGNATSAFDSQVDYSKTGGGHFDGPAETLKGDVRGEK